MFVHPTDAKGLRNATEKATRELNNDMYFCARDAIFYVPSVPAFSSIFFSHQARERALSKDIGVRLVLLRHPEKQNGIY